jgi:hypothetical protein
MRARKIAPLTDIAAVVDRPALWSMPKLINVSTRLFSLPSALSDIIHKTMRAIRPPVLQALLRQNLNIVLNSRA